MSNKRLYCPHEGGCPIYRSWVEQTKDRRLDIIFKEGKVYRCLAITALKDPVSEGGIKAGSDINARNPEASKEGIKFDCSTIKLLNQLEKLANE